MADASSSLQARETLALLSRISKLLKTGLDTESLVICTRLCEAGIHPEALAKAILEVRREVNVAKTKATDHEDSESRQLL